MLPELPRPQLWVVSRFTIRGQSDEAVVLAPICLADQDPGGGRPQRLVNVHGPELGAAPDRARCPAGASRAVTNA